jgi:hypothetical protein
VHIGPVVQLGADVDYSEATRLLETAVRDA